MRRLSSLATAAAAVAQRTMFVYSQQSPVLEANQKALGSDLNVWVEDWEVKRFNIPIVKDEPTMLTIEKGLELYNYNDLENAPESMEMPQHTSHVSRKAYGKRLQVELSDRAVKKGYSSKYWIPSGAIRKEGLQLKQGARATIVLSAGNVKLYHVSQLQDAERIARWPVSGGTRRPYSQTSAQYTELLKCIALQSYKSGLFYTKRQAEALHLQPAANESPFVVEVPIDTRNATLYYNVDQLELPEQALRTLNRADVEVPSFLLSGEPVRNTNNLPTNFTSKYWLSARDAQMYNFAVKNGEKGTVLSSRTNTIECYHAEQFIDVNAAYKAAGHYVQ